MGKTWAKELSDLVKKLDRAYRSGNAQVSDKQFDQLENRLRKIDPQNSYFQQKMKLLSLDNYCFSEWWADKARNETMIVQPKFDGCALGVEARDGRHLMKPWCLCTNDNFILTNFTGKMCTRDHESPW